MTKQLPGLISWGAQASLQCLGKCSILNSKRLESRRGCWFYLQKSTQRKYYFVVSLHQVVNVSEFESQFKLNVRLSYCRIICVGRTLFQVISIKNILQMPIWMDNRGLAVESFCFLKLKKLKSLSHIISVMAAE